MSDIITITTWAICFVLIPSTVGNGETQVKDFRALWDKGFTRKPPVGTSLPALLAWVVIS